MMNDFQRERFLADMRVQHIEEEALSKADAVIMEQCTGADEMLELTYRVAMRMMEKVGFHINLERERKRIAKELGTALGDKDK